jgi:hypothetical protein
MGSFAPIPLEVFRERTGMAVSDLVPHWGEARRIVSLRDIVKVESVQAMSREYLWRLIDNVSLIGDPSVKPYAGCRSQILRMDPHGVLVAQTFVERPKYLRILENVSGFFGDFCMTRGIAKLNACIVLGRDAAGEQAIGHYLPPIVEEHEGRMHLLDGTHRNFLVKSVGTTIETIVIRKVKTPFPCVPQQWKTVRGVDEKPPVAERFEDLRPELFRDVKSIGIDG